METRSMGVQLRFTSCSMRRLKVIIETTIWPFLVRKEATEKRNRLSGDWAIDFERFPIESVQIYTNYVCYKQNKTQSRTGGLFVLNYVNASEDTKTPNENSLSSWVKGQGIILGIKPCWNLMSVATFPNTSTSAEPRSELKIEILELKYLGYESKEIRYA